MNSTTEVLDRHLKSLGARDLDGIVADYAADVVALTPGGFFSPDGILRGKPAMRKAFQKLLADFSKPGASFTLKQMSVAGDYAYIVWSAETPDNIYEPGSDTFVVRDGKIVAQSFAAKITPKR
jgi:ketosteroid isomerase-like protein